MRGCNEVRLRHVRISVTEVVSPVTNLSMLRICLLLTAPAISALAAPNALERGYSHMYDLQFADAHKAFAEWNQARPSDPLGPVSDAAAYLFSEFDRLHILQSEFFTHDQHYLTDHKLSPDPNIKQQFYRALEQGRAIAVKASPFDKDAQFASILANGLESDYLALIEKRYTASFQKMKLARTQAERLLASDPTYYDAWVAVGVENYVLSAKAALMRWLLRLSGGQTNKAVGVEKLKLVAEKGRYLAPFARLLLAVAALRDNNHGRARDLLAELSRDYPHNPLYREELTRIEPLARSTR